MCVGMGQMYSGRAGVSASVCAYVCVHARACVPVLCSTAVAILGVTSDI